MVIYNGLDRLDFELRDHVGSLFPAAKGCLTCFVLHHRRRSRRKTDGAPNIPSWATQKKTRSYYAEHATITYGWLALWLTCFFSLASFSPSSVAQFSLSLVLCSSQSRTCISRVDGRYQHQAAQATRRQRQAAAAQQNGCQGVSLPCLLGLGQSKVLLLVQDGGARQIRR